MKIKLDENLPAALMPILTGLGHEPDNVASEGMKGCPDSAVWLAAQHARRFLITQDLDFSDIRRFRPGTHHGILLVRLAMPGRKALTECVHRLFRTQQVETWKGCFVVVTDRKLRVRRP